MGAYRYWDIGKRGTFFILKVCESYRSSRSSSPDCNFFYILRLTNNRLNGFLYFCIKKGDVFIKSLLFRLITKECTQSWLVKAFFSFKFAENSSKRSAQELPGKLAEFIIWLELDTLIISPLTIPIIESI